MGNRHFFIMVKGYEQVQHTIFTTFKKTFTVPLWVLAFIEAYSIWQMGVLYYSTKAFTIEGVTPIPVAVDKVIVFLIIGYIVGAALSFFFPRHVSLWGRITAAVSLMCTVLMFFPLPDDIFALIFYISAIGCTVFVGVCAALIVNLYSLKTALKDALTAAIVTAPFIAILQNGFIEIDFVVFNIFSATVLLLMLIGLFSIPARCDIPLNSRAADTTLPAKSEADEKSAEAGKASAPIGLFIQTFLAFTIAALCTLFSSTTAEALSHGIFTYYLAAAFWGVVFAILYYKLKMHPLRLYTVFFGIVALGFVLWLLPFQSTRYISIVLQSAGYFTNIASWFIAGILFENCGSRLIAPLTVINALVLVIFNFLLVETFRSSPSILYATFAGIILVLLIIYFLTEPYCRSFGEECIRDMRNVGGEQLPPLPETNFEEISQVHIQQTQSDAHEISAVADSELLSLLTNREAEVADLIARGHNNAGIAQILSASEHTVKTHTKNIYRKLGVHSRYELAAMVNKNKIDMPNIDKI